MTYLPILAFAGVYLAVELIWAVPPVAAVVYAAASVVCFIAYARDKAAAQARRRRTPERTLLLLGLAGGWPGALLAQRWLRHKSVKPTFRAKFWLTVWLNAGMFIWIAFGLDRLR